MKQNLLLLLMVLIGYSSYAQISYEPGYYIDNNGDRHDVLIKNIDWRQNPTSFDYKTAENGNPETVSIQNVQEFGITDHSVYRRFTVGIDQSSENKNDLSRQRGADLVEQTVFLRLLLDGDASLYQFVGDSNRFFYSVDDSQISQLIYKKFQNGNQIRTNNRFRQQLLNEVSCGDVDQNDIQRVNYSRSSLINYFEDYNECRGSGSIKIIKKNSEGKFRLKVLAGLTFGSLELERIGSVYTLDKSLSMTTDLSPRVGFEAEYLLPFNKQKWSVFAAPSYQQVSGEEDFHHKSYQPEAFTTVNVEYKTFVVPVGIRYHFYFNEVSHLFVDAAYSLGFFFNDTITDSENAFNGEMEVASAVQTIELGMGYEFRDFGVQLKYALPKDNFSDHPSEMGSSLGRWEGVYSSVSVMLTYSIF